MKVMQRCEICKQNIATLNCRLCQRNVCDKCLVKGICKKCLPTIY
ncbi:MAG: B-box zinc finger protein [Nanoarchaeota archaeon]